jgi:cellulose synthase/poly-beta-1,6-N-acetylglucosamine synthase-like glycosyltransferase
MDPNKPFLLDRPPLSRPPLTRPLAVSYRPLYILRIIIIITIIITMTITMIIMIMIIIMMMYTSIHIVDERLARDKGIRSWT